MVRPRSAVLVMEDPADSMGPLMLRDFLAEPILSRMGRQLLADGIQRIFLACGPEYAIRARACLPAEAEVTVSDRHSALMDFLDTQDDVLVLCRAAVPDAQAGPGFAYAAPGAELRAVWGERPGSVQGAEPVPGWLPVYGPETIAELEAVLQARGGV